MAAAELPPSRKNIEELALAEGHDADIPSNIGSIPMSPEKDVERTAGMPVTGYNDSSRASSPIGKHEKKSGEVEVDLVVDWDGPDDPENPMNWSKGRKWGAIAVVSIITFLTPLGSSSFAPGVPLIMKEFDNDSTLLSGFVVSVYVLGFAVGPLFIAPLSEMYGRLPLYHISGVLFLLFNIACALAHSLPSLVIFRFFAGCFGATPLTVGGGTIADVAHAELRPTAMAIWTLGLCIGPVIGPVAGGFICDYLGWRWNFWVIAIAAAVILAIGAVLMRETYAPTILARKARRLRKETGNMRLRSRLDNGMTSFELFKYSIVRPMKMLFRSPICFSMSLYVSLTYSYLYIMFTTVSVIFETRYHFRHDLVGLAFLGIGVGSIFGQFGYTHFENRNYAYHKKKGDLKPEHRLNSMFVGAFCLPVSMFWYGWSVEAGVHWMCPIVAMAVFGVGLLVIFLSASNYLVDVFTAHAASAMAARTVLQSLLAALIPLAGPSLYGTLGYGWGGSLLGFISCAMIPVPFLFVRYGEWLRTDPRWQVKL